MEVYIIRLSHGCEGPSSEKEALCPNGGVRTGEGWGVRLCAGQNQQRTRWLRGLMTPGWRDGGQRGPHVISTI